MNVHTTKTFVLALLVAAVTFFASSTGFAQSWRGQPGYGQSPQQTSGAWNTRQLGARLQGLYQNLQQIRRYGMQLHQQLATLQRQVQQTHPAYRQRVYMQMQQLQNQLRNVQQQYTQVVYQLRQLHAYLGRLMNANPSEQMRAAVSALRPFTQGHPQAQTAVGAVGVVIDLLAQTGVVK